MAEYYGVIRHSMVGVKRGPYKNSKFIAKINTPSGKARYIYDPAELAAYKGNKAKVSGEFTPLSKSGKKKKKVAGSTRPASFGNTHLSAGALNYAGVNENDDVVTSEPIQKKKKKKKAKSSVAKVVATFNRIR